MKARIITCTHQVLELPALLEWNVVHTGGVPCDSFSVTFFYDASMAEPLHLAAGFVALENGTVMLRGIVDEYTVDLGTGGLTATVCGRGYAARLLDNESRPMTYEGATLEEILRNHVTPYGIQTAPGAALPAVTRFSVATGSSEWSVVYDFARYYGGVCPRFDRLGRLTAVDAIHRAVIVAPIFQLGLDGPHLLTAGALPVGRRLGLLGQGDHRNIHHKQKGQRPRQPPLLRHAFASIPGNSVRRQTGGYERQFFPAAGIGILKSGHTGRKQERMCPGW